MATPILFMTSIASLMYAPYLITKTAWAEG